MALPKLLQKLFQNGGAGDKLNPEIVPEIKKLMLGDHVLELQEDGTLKLDENVVITSAGGSMTGSIQLSGQSVFAKRDVDDSELVIFGGTTSDNGAYFQATGKDSWGGGEFWIVAKDASRKIEVNGKPDGTLTWGGKEVERVYSTYKGGNDAIRYESGLQICFMQVEMEKWNTFAVPFAFNPYVVITHINDWTVVQSPASFAVTDVNTTGVWVRGQYTGSTGSVDHLVANAIAIGWWK